MKKIFFAAMILAALLLVSGVAAQDATPESTPEPTNQPTLQPTRQPTRQPTTGLLFPIATHTPQPTIEVSREAAATPEGTPEATAEGTLEATSEATAESTLPPGAFANFPGPGSYTVREPTPQGERTYRVYIPTSYDESGAPTPLAIIMHGAGGAGADTEAYVGFDALADADNFVVVYPNGANNVWNDGRQGDPRISNVDDVSFINDIVLFMEQSLHIDPQRVYAGGYSMGGMMAYRLGCELPNRFAAVASIASTMPIYLIQDCTGTVPIPVIVFQGTDDPVVPWTGINGGYLSAAQTLAFWGNHNQCAGDLTIDTLPDTVPHDYTVVLRQQIAQCAADIVLYGIYFGGHTWPGHPINVPQLGQTTGDIDATAIMWDFFSAHPKAAAP